MTNANFTQDTHRSIGALLEYVRDVSTGLADELQDIVAEGREHPMTREEAAAQLRRLFRELQAEGRVIFDNQGREMTQEDVERAAQTIAAGGERRVQNSPPESSPNQIQLFGKDGKSVEPVIPAPVYHGRQVPMNAGWVQVRDIQLWDQNDRLEIHLSQFLAQNGRRPNEAELLDIMLSQASLPGLADVPDAKASEISDQFQIRELARSIAANGVRQPPIIANDGTLLDGNRRVAACHFVLSNPDFSPEEKKRASEVYVWQLTEHASPEDRHIVVVSLNFEDDCKQRWPDYIRARKVYERWEEMLALEPRDPSPRQAATLKKQLAKEFALGVDTHTVNRYLKMVGYANEFEDHHIIDRNRNEHEVRHRASRYFQYFDELSKGEKPGGVAYAINQDDAFRGLVFDLLYDGKFRNWRNIRDLKFIFENEDARKQLNEARNEPNLVEAQERLDDAMAIAKAEKAEQRALGANSRILNFVKWLGTLRLGSFNSDIKQETLQALKDALELVNKYIHALEEEERRKSCRDSD